MDFNNLVQTVLIFALPVLFAITGSEAAQGYVARARGDGTAAAMGRVTLNPLKHVDPIGTLLIPLVMYFATSGAFMLGYAKPMPIDYRNLRNPRRDMMWIALAGPAANFVQAMAWALLFGLYGAFGVSERFFVEMARAGILVNLVFWAFNLFPLPPLAGGRLLMGLLPQRAAYALSRVEPWGFFIVLGLVLFGILGTYWLRPLIALGFGLVHLLVNPFISLLT